MKISVIGSGYVGLVTGACLAEVGNNVLCLDLDQSKIDSLNKGLVPIYEPGLSEMVSRNVAAGRISFTTDIAESVRFGEIQFIAVGTPPGEDGSADLQYVLAAANNIAKHMNHPILVVNKSTVPVGTADKVRIEMERVLLERGLPITFDVASNPEFLKEGAAIDDFMRPDRIILGTDNDASLAKLRSLYAPFQRNSDRIITMDVRSAELTKYAANAMLATRISFMNEMSNLADCLGADIEMVRKGIGSDPRIGNQFLYPGCGYGGSCFPKDVQALIRTADELDCKLGVLGSVEQANNRQKHVLVEKVKSHFGQDLSGKRFALWGLAFKPNTDDMRAAPSLTVIRELIHAGAEVCVYDPVAMHEASKYINDNAVVFADSAWNAVGHENCDALIVVTEWKEFRSIDFLELKIRLRSPVVFDGRNIYNPVEMMSNGFDYFCIGRNAMSSKGLK